MICPYCGNSTKVTNSRKQKKSSRIWRRRHCDKCNAVFTTFESFDTSSLTITKDITRRSESFSDTKLLISIYESCKHRKTAAEDSRALTNTVINLLLRQKHQGQIINKDIQRLTLMVLHNFDRVAEIHYKAYFSSKG